MKHSTRRPSGPRGSALLIVLAFLLLLTTLTVAFLSRATLERQLSNASFSQGKIDFAAQGAVASIISDLQQEIMAGSNVGAGTTVPAVASGYYYPNSPATVTPYVVGFTPAAGVEDLLKISKNGSAFYSGTSYNTTSYPAPNRASSINTLNNPSLNNRLISLSRWNAPLLMAKATSTSTTDFTPVSAFANNPPDWIYVARDGSNPTTYTSAYGVTGSNAVTQRYAYAIYDEGSTLDLNVAGNPSYSTSAVTYSNIQPYKNALAYADLTQLPGISTPTLSAAQQVALVNAIVGWRNGASAGAQVSGSLASFPGTPTAYAFNNTGTIKPFDLNVISNMSGFLGGIPVSALQKSANYGTAALPALNQTDNSFTSRQQLLQFFTQGLGLNSSFATKLGFVSTTALQAAMENLLPYFGTFSRDINQPSYAPDPNKVSNAPMLSEANGGNDSGNSTGTNGKDNTLNPSFLNVTAPSTSFIRNDGSNSVTGEPLVKKRFALMRLAWLTYQGPSAGRNISSPSSTAGNADYDIYLLENTYGIPKSFLAQGTAANIYRYFGLSWIADTRTNGDGNNKWIYTHTTANPAITATTSPITALPTVGSGVPIYTLSQITSRDPDFFELLKAGICAGSLGKAATSGSTPTPEYYQNLKDLSIDAQIIQMGANIIDQFDTDGYPTHILFDDGFTQPLTQEYNGVEDLPYVYRINGGIVKIHDSSPSSNSAQIPIPNTGVNALTDTGVAVVLQEPIIWNPHALNSAASTGPRPTSFRAIGISATPAYPDPGAAATSMIVQASTRYEVVPAYPQPPPPNQNQVCPVSYSPWTPTSKPLQTAVTWTPATTELDFNIPTTRLDLFHEPTVLCKPNVPTDSSLRLGAANTLLVDPAVTSYLGSVTSSAGSVVCKGVLAVNVNPTYPTTPVALTDNKLYLGMSMGSIPLRWVQSNVAATPKTGVTPSYPASPTQNYVYSANDASGGLSQATYRLQYEYPTGSGTWFTYDEKYADLVFDTQTNNNGSPATDKFNISDSLPFGNDASAAYTDPRTARFGMTSSSSSYSSTHSSQWPGWAGFPTSAPSTASKQNAAQQNAYLTARPDQGTGYILNPLNSVKGWSASIASSTAASYPPGALAQNNATAPRSSIRTLLADGQNIQSTPAGYDYFADADGVVRRGMAGYMPTDTTTPRPAAILSSSYPSGNPLAIAYQFAATTTTAGITSGGTASPIVSPGEPESASRPIILNRPFRSVAELGYAFSGTPWRNIDFLTPESGSSALLDVFTVNDTNDPKGLVAGKINLNTRQAAVLQAVLAGAYKDDPSTASTYYPPTAANAPYVIQASSAASTTASADNIAKAIVAWTSDVTTVDVTKGTGPFRNLSELVGKYSSLPTALATGPSIYDGSQMFAGFSGTMTTASGTAPTPPVTNLSSLLYSDYNAGATVASISSMNIQRYREATVRALANTGTTRVWNLMIDVIAQTGRFPSSTSRLADFAVEGERRYWVHVAIDRYTGKVLDEQIEEVKE